VNRKFNQKGKDLIQRLLTVRARRTRASERGKKASERGKEQASVGKSRLVQNGGSLGYHAK
jgi:hypothetical protein